MSIATAIIASGVMWFASSGANHVWPLAWLAPVPLLVIVPRFGATRAALAALAASSIGALSLAFTYAGALPPLFLGVIVLTISVPFALIVVAWRAIDRRLPAALSAVAYAALVVCVELGMSVASPNGTFGSLAYSQTDVLPVIQIASLTGLWGVSFLLSILAAGIAVAWRNRGSRRALGALAVGVVPLVAALAFGIVRLAAPSQSARVRVGLAANDATVSNFDADHASAALPVVRAYAQRAARLSARGAQVVVLPEKFVGLAPAYADEARTILSRTARDYGITIVAGFNVLPAGGGPAARPSNTAVVFDPEGRAVLEYDKIHLVPGFESGYQAGRAIGVLDRPPVAIGVAICKDLDFVALGRAHAQAGVGLLLVPAWDFVRDGWLHSRMALMRAVENGYALARTASEGRLTIADARGRLVAEAVSSDAPEVLLAADVAVARGGTFYSRAGDWFAWACVGIALACAAAAAARRTRQALR